MTPFLESDGVITYCVLFALKEMRFTLKTALESIFYRKKVHWDTLVGFSNINILWLGHCINSGSEKKHWTYCWELLKLRSHKKGVVARILKYLENVKPHETGQPIQAEQKIMVTI